MSPALPLRRLLLLLPLALWCTAVPARADDAGRISVIEENDFPFGRDRHYTQGTRLSYLSPAVTHGSDLDPFATLGDLLPIFPGDDATGRRYDLLVGQSLFTPQHTSLSRPDPRDRPYAGWLYGGVSLLQETDHRMLENLELDLGVVGPAALGQQMQNDFHQLIGAATAKGWGHQLENEPGLMLSYERTWRFARPLGDGLAVDVLPQLGATVGNVMTYGEAGALLRFGRNLGADYGPARIRPAPSGTDYFNPAGLDGNLGLYGFVGFQGRFVGRNIFLDGNSFRKSPSVDKEPLVADLTAGVSSFWSRRLRLDLAVVHRTAEFEHQRGGDTYGGLDLSFAFW